MQRLFLILEACDLSEVYSVLRCSHLILDSIEFYFDLNSKSADFDFIGLKNFENGISSYEFNRRFSQLIDNMLVKIDKLKNKLNHETKQ